MIEELKIITLVEDSAPKRPFLGEHGLALWIKADRKNILFDTGFSGKALLHNIKAFGLKLENLDAFVLSHPHDDHSGGIKAILEELKNIPVYCISNAFDEFTQDKRPPL